MKVGLIKKALLFVATFYAVAFIVAVWAERVFSGFFIKLSITAAVVEILLGIYFYFAYWHADDKKDKKDYFAD